MPSVLCVEGGQGCLGPASPQPAHRGCRSLGPCLLLPCQGATHHHVPPLLLLGGYTSQGSYWNQEKCNLMLQKIPWKT